MTDLQPTRERWTIYLCSKCGKERRSAREWCCRERAPGQIMRAVPIREVEVVPAATAERLAEALREIRLHHAIPAGEWWEQAYNEVCTFAIEALQAFEGQAQ
jgi:hypothetical protein